MSLINEVDIYKSMVPKEMTKKSCSLEYETSEFLLLPKCDQIEETLIVGEEIVVDENADANQELTGNTVKVKDGTLYFEENLNQSTEVPVDFIENCTTATMSGDSKIKDRWDHNSFNKMSDIEDGDEEETIATFVTATGQQLALYAVEDSEEIFAVAVYDESGDPPTNFQFLMKADVERLIGEGAVRTVKKPTQIKKQLLTTQPPIFFSKGSIHRQPESNENKTVLGENYQTSQKHFMWEKNSDLIEDSNTQLEIKPTSKIMYTTTDESEDNPEDLESENEIIEQSTVQYILFEGDQSDTELTFDEIQATLQNIKSEPKSVSRKAANKKPVIQQNNGNKMMIVNSNVNHIEDVKHHVLSPTSINSEDYEYQMDQSIESDIFDYTSTTLAERKQKLVDSEQDLLDTLADSLSNESSDGLKMNDRNGSLECTESESTQTSFRAKRSRKQQLTSVNRDDSEIIIQPASLLNEEDDSFRKRGKRKKRIISHTGYQEKSSDAKKFRKIKHKEVEIIEIDIDEEESIYHTKRDVVEITIDDSKDKYSSDKENEIIMVGDSDDELEEHRTKQTTLLLQCEYCSRNFRQRRALDTHLRVCSKSPSNTLKLSAHEMQHVSENDEPVKKQYACKICQKKFDVVVALARHVRSEHSQKKKHKRNKSLMEEEPGKTFPTEGLKTQITMIKRAKKKKNQHSSCAWDVKKLNCIDCGRWFPSAALLNAHYLQHGTKKSEQQIRRCQICKKLIKSRLLFVQHLKMHSNTKQNTKSVANILEKKLRTTRQVARKITTLRKRGRPRKL